MTTITDLINAHTSAIEDLETIQMVLDAVRNLATNTHGPLFDWDLEGDDYVPHLINPRAPEIVTEAVQAIEEHFLLTCSDEDKLAETPQKGDLLFVTPKEA